jgi:O-antigen/teichoic acid export membrane protein
MKKYFSIFASEVAIPAQGLGEFSLKLPELALAKLYAHFTTNSLFRNSIYLMVSTAIQALFGFFFWIINARLFTTVEVGIATTIISVGTLITSLSLLGFNAGLVRYLPSSKEKNVKINTAITLVTLMAMVISVCYLLGVHIFSPRLQFINKSIFLSVSFIILMIAITLNMLSENIFIAYRSTKYILYKNAILSVTKVIFPFLLITFGSMGIFFSYGLSICIGLILSVFFLTNKFSYVLKPVISKEVINKMLKFSFGNYMANFIAQAPMNLLPIIITNKLGPSTSAYFYMCMMIANLLYIIPIAVSQSLFAEGSYNEKALVLHLKKAISTIAMLLLPGILITVLLGKYVLFAFGKEYSFESFHFLQLIAFAGVFVAVNNIGSALFNIKHKVGYTVLLNALNVGIIVGLSYILINFQLTGIGVAWLMGQAVTAVVFVILLLKLL